MLIALLSMIQFQTHGFMPSQPTREYQCEQLGRVFLSGDDGRVLATAREETAVGCFVREPAYGAKTQVNGAGGELTGFEMRAITQDYNPIEGQARFRAIPVNELIDGVTITPLCVC